MQRPVGLNLPWPLQNMFLCLFGGCVDRPNLILLCFLNSKKTYVCG